MYRIHLYENGGLLGEDSFPKFPCNSYETNNKETLLKELYALFNNEQSGISRILIENNSFDIEKRVEQAQAIINIDK